MPRRYASLAPASRPRFSINTDVAVEGGAVVCPRNSLHKLLLVGGAVVAHAIVFQWPANLADDKKRSSAPQFRLRLSARPAIRRLVLARKKTKKRAPFGFDVVLRGMYSGKGRGYISENFLQGSFVADSAKTSRGRLRLPKVWLRAQAYASFTWSKRPGTELCRSACGRRPRMLFRADRFQSWDARRLIQRSAAYRHNRLRFPRPSPGCHGFL